MDVEAQNGASQARSAEKTPVPDVDSAQWARIATDYETPGATWEYHRVVYNMLDFAHRWPEGMAAHFSWPSPDGWRIVGIWKSEQHHEEYFASVVVEEVSRAIGLMGPVSNPRGAADVEPLRRPVARMVVGPLARKFVDVGPDTEGTAVYALGGEPIAIEIDVAGMDSGTYSLLVERLGYRSAIPSALIAHCAIEIEDGMRIFEVWSGRDDALATLAASLLPTVELIAAEQKQDLACDYSTHDLRRILFSDEVVKGFGF
jgi:hypothetical protein